MMCKAFRGVGEEKLQLRRSELEGASKDEDSDGLPLETLTWGLHAWTQHLAWQ